MSKGRFMGFISKAAVLAGSFIPGAAVAGTIAGKAAEFIKNKDLQKKIWSDQKKQNEKSTKYVGSVLGGNSPGTAKFGIVLSDIWDFVRKNWYLVLPGVLALMWVLFFKKKSRVTRRRRTFTPRSRGLTNRRPVKKSSANGKAWAHRMLLARRRKAAARRRK